MAGGIDKGLSSSRWASGRPYRLNSSTTTTTSTALSGPPAARPILPSDGADSTDAYNPPPTDTPGDPFDVHSALGRVPTPWAELSRFKMITRRLKWKLQFLGAGYELATNRGLMHEDRREAETNFQLDFYEYYKFIERALIHLLGVFGIKITGDIGRRHLGNGNKEQQSEHRFHANVLEALDDCRNPLHEALGNHDARFALGRAKELRNRWKNADEPDPILAAKNNRNARPLDEYDLERVLTLIIHSLDRGHQIAEQYVAELDAFAAERGVSSHTAQLNMDPPDEWGFMTDAMDWETV